MNLRVQIRFALLRGQIGSQRRGLQLPGQPQAGNFQMALGVERADAAKPAAAQHTPLPPYIGPRRHRPRLERKNKISRQLVQIEAALRMPLEFSCLQRKVEVFGGARSVQIEPRIERTQARQRQDIFQGPMGGLVQS